MSHSSPSSSRPVLLSPALPSELLAHVLRHHRHPTVLVICGTRQHFMSMLVQDVLQQQISLGLHGATHLSAKEAQTLSIPAHDLLVAPLAQVAVSRHIRLVFVPTVTHLEAWLSVFEPGDTNIPPPPQRDQQPPQEPRLAREASRPLLLAYGFLSLHRDTSEWSAQGISKATAALVEAASRTGFQATVVEPLELDEHGDVRDLESLLHESAPVLSGSIRRGIDEERWTGRTVNVGGIIRRWFVIQEVEWDVGRAEVHPLPTQAGSDGYNEDRLASSDVDFQISSGKLVDPMLQDEVDSSGNDDDFAIEAADDI